MTIGIKKSPLIPVLLGLTTLLSVACTDGGRALSGPGTPPPANPGNWKAVWGTAQQGTTNLDEQTLRLIVRSTGQGNAVRIKLRNFLGADPVTVAAATVGIRDTNADVVPGTIRPLTFGGSDSITIAPGEDVFSDGVQFAVANQQDLAISLYISGTANVSQDGNAFVTSYRTAIGDGDHVLEESGAAFTTSSAAVPLLEEVSVQSSTIAGVIVAAGGSVVDGTGSPADSYGRWTSWLARRMVEELPMGERLTVINEGIGGNTTTDVINRFDRDVLDKSGITHVVIYAGTNDLTTSAPGTGAEIIDNYRTLIQRSHDAGLKIIIATVTPRVSYTAAGNAERKLVNDWLRRGQNCSGECDGIVDFDAAVESYANPNQIEPTWDTDTIHPNGTGYGVMAQMFNLKTFTPDCPDNCSIPLHPFGPGSPGAMAPRSSAISKGGGGSWHAIWGTAHTGASNVSNESIRIPFRATGAGNQVRIKLRNFFGDVDAQVDAATIAVRTSGAAIDPATLTPLTFGGSPAVTVPAGGDVYSDDLPFTVANQQDLAVTLYVSSTGNASEDGNAYVTTYTAAGDLSSETDGLGWTPSSGLLSAPVPLLEEVAVLSNTIAGTIVMAGGSVVDGFGSDIDGYNRGSDWLARRMFEELPEGERFTVINEGINGNTTTDVINRLDRDVLDKTGITHVMIYAGTNDLSGSPTGEGQRIIDNYRMIIQSARALGLETIIATITPRVSYSTTGNFERKLANDWLRRGQNCSGECAGIVDYDAAIEASSNPNQIEPTYDTDTIHPNGTGYGLMVQMFNLATFQPQCPDNCSLPLHPVGPGAPGVMP